MRAGLQHLNVLLMPNGGLDPRRRPVLYPRDGRIEQTAARRPTGDMGTHKVEMKVKEKRHHQVMANKSKL